MHFFSDYFGVCSFKGRGVRHASFLPDWRHVADNIPILTFKDGTTRANVSYKGAIIKQADVNLLAYPLKIIGGEENIRKDWAYYEPRMDKGRFPMAHAILAVLYAQLSETKKAHELFTQSVCFKSENLSKV